MDAIFVCVMALVVVSVGLLALVALRRLLSLEG